MTAKYQDVIRFLVQIRERQGLTQRRVAERMFVQPNSISRFELARSAPQLQTVLEYCAAIGVVLSVRTDEAAMAEAEARDAARAAVVRQEEPK